MSERVEWEVLHVDIHGRIKRHNEGAQFRFGLSRAQQIAKALGPPWVVNHFYTLAHPEGHAVWLQNLQPPQRQKFEQQCVDNPHPHGTKPEQ